MRALDVFVRRPVLAVVVNLALVLIGLRAATELPIQQYPRIESSSVIITTPYIGAPADVVRGFVTTPIERAVSSMTGVDYVEFLERRRAEHRDGAPRAEPPEQHSTRRGRQPPRPDPRRAARGGRGAGRRGAARRPALRHLLRRGDLRDDDAVAADRLPRPRDPAAALARSPTCSASGSRGRGTRRCASGSNRRGSRPSGSAPPTSRARSRATTC